MRPDIVPGATFPNYALPDQDGTVRRLSELQDGDPMILVLTRGHFCPKDHQQHREIVELLPRIDVAYTKIVTITTDDAHGCWDMKKATGATWPFLSDPGRIVQRDLEIREHTDPHHDPMVPHTLALAPDLLVHSIYCGYWFWTPLPRRPLARPARGPAADQARLRSHATAGGLTAAVLLTSR